MADDPTRVDETLTAPGGPLPARPVARELRTVDAGLYEVGAEIAHGGMGRIRAARDLRLDREVAIKELLEPDAEAALRFEREALVTARLQHPGIVAIYEAGRWPSGEPFYAMKRVHGRSLKNVIGEAGGFDARLALLPHVAAVADAMAYAHEQRIVHRDLKPANVLVGEFGETVVIDWGLAKDLAAADDVVATASRTSDASLTRAGSVMGTPQYMPPEQARGEPIDERADVYAIGAMLYHLLAGEPPFARESSQQVLAKVVAEAPEPLARHVRGVAPDLLAIVERAMARDPAARYPTARELADDLRRFQTGQLVASHRYTRGELLRRFVRRHRVPLAIAGVAALVVAAGALVSVQRIRDERDQAHAERRRAEGQRAMAEQERATAQERADELTISEAAHELDTNPLAALLSLARVSAGSPKLAAARVIAADAVARHAPSVRDLQIDDINAIDVSEDGQHLALASGDHSVYVLDLDKDQAKPPAVRHHDDRAEHVVYSRDGRVMASSALDGTVQVWDVAGTHVATFAATNDVVALALSNDGARLAIVTMEPRLRVYDVAAARQVFEAPGTRGPVAVARDGSSFAWTWGDSVHVLELAAMKERTFRIGQITVAAFSPDGKLAAFARPDDTISVVELDGGRVRALGRSPATSISALAFTPDAARLVTAGASGEVRTWPVAGGASRALGMHGITPEGDALDVQVAPDGKTAITTGKTAQLWDLDTGDAVPLLGPRDDVTHWRYSPDGAFVLGISGHELWTWPAHGDERALARAAGAIHQVSYLPDGRALVAAEDAIEIAGEPPLALPAPLVGRVAFTADRSRGALLGGDGIVRVL
ncbi:MAG: WD40 repeat domain-containing serine/threonine protein kinase, partial [Acidobacteriota bacterium]